VDIIIYSITVSVSKSKRSYTQPQRRDNERVTPKSENSFLNEETITIKTFSRANARENIFRRCKRLFLSLSLPDIIIFYCYCSANDFGGPSAKYITNIWGHQRSAVRSARRQRSASGGRRRPLMRCSRLRGGSILHPLVRIMTRDTLTHTNCSLSRSL
jgi:hypothetical protein